MSANTSCGGGIVSPWGNQTSLLFFFLLLVIIFCRCSIFGPDNRDSLLFFFLLLIILFGGRYFF